MTVFTRVTASILLALAASAMAQQDAAPITTLRTGTRLVVLDVLVQDHDGHPIHDLKSSDFLVREEGEPVTVRHFEEHVAAPAQPAAPAPKLPPGTFSDYSPVAATGPLNIFLLDALNTTVKDQTYALLQLQKFLDHAPAGTQIAIFGLSSRLYLLKGFTTDASALKDAVAHKLRPAGSLLLDDAAGNNADQTRTSQLAGDAGPASITPTGNDLLVATLQQFEADAAALQTQLRIQYTLDGLNQLGRYLANFPGRKSVFWFSAAFPINILPDPTVPNSFNAAQNNAAEYQETSDLLTRAQVAVYPVDARGLNTPPLYDAARSGRSLAHPNSVSAELSQYNATQAIEHQTMDQLALDTGGKAFYNTNGLAESVAKAIDAGNHYYTLAYSPASSPEPGIYRHLHVALAGALAARGYQLSYRQGYYADSARPGSAYSAADPVRHTAEIYGRLAMSHGAPTPADILFKASVVPAADVASPTTAPGNQLASNAKGPFQRYAVSYAAAPEGFTLTDSHNGRFLGAIQFSAFVFDADGKLIDSAGSTVSLNLTAGTREQFLADAVRFHLDISAPVKGTSFLRITVRDVPSNRFGAIELSTADILRATKR